MDLARAPALSAPLTATEHRQVQRAAAAGQGVEEFVRVAVLDAATDPFRDALEGAVDTVADRIQHNYGSA
ncbi:hypothetical protein [Streptomyces atratus]|uniref:hypothetical protein n=1 Tax=Streptomyces atratus TaxID=1893 RepID=UPI00225BF11C|nr:hypothetical protein [Streptomyces atratus]MCX5345774.1 hypothetical protein [Streptomyces atratus]MCX5345791.1 hypothetical protein [Streptomyces atratus]